MSNPITPRQLAVFVLVGLLGGLALGCSSDNKGVIMPTDTKTTGSAQVDPQAPPREKVAPIK